MTREFYLEQIRECQDEVEYCKRCISEKKDEITQLQAIEDSFDALDCAVVKASNSAEQHVGELTSMVCNVGKLVSHLYSKSIYSGTSYQECRSSKQKATQNIESAKQERKKAIADLEEKIGELKDKIRSLRFEMQNCDREVECV